MQKITLEEWRTTHVDYKGYANGIPYLLVNENGATLSVPVEIDRSVPAKISADKYIGIWTIGMMQEPPEIREAVEAAFRRAVEENEDWMYSVEISGRKFYLVENGELGFTGMLPSEY